MAYSSVRWVRWPTLWAWGGDRVVSGWWRCAGILLLIQRPWCHRLALRCWRTVTSTMLAMRMRIARSRMSSLWTGLGRSKGGRGSSHVAHVAQISPRRSLARWKIRLSASQAIPCCSPGPVDDDRRGARRGTTSTMGRVDPHGCSPVQAVAPPASMSSGPCARTESQDGAWPWARCALSAAWASRRATMGSRPRPRWDQYKSACMEAHTKGAEGSWPAGAVFDFERESRLVERPRGRSHPSDPTNHTERRACAMVTLMGI
jgi:hypothetical protein